MSDLFQSRLQKLDEIRSKGINPYPYKYERTHFASQILETHRDLAIGQSGAKGVKISGRLMAVRSHGASTFLDVYDESGRIQVLAKKDDITNDYELLKLLDIGDFMAVEGEVFRTSTNEITLRAFALTLLCKSLRPLPEKWHGIQDPELKYRARSEYLCMNPEYRQIFVKRTRAIAVMKEYLDSVGFLEVETPILQPVYGGASARPFRTRVNALDRDFYLSISPELYLKRLIVGGFERVYTICKNFRNEGIDRSHNPEFTMMECYQAYADYNDMMVLTENMYAHIFTKVLGTAVVEYPIGESYQTINFTVPWLRNSMLELVEESAGLQAKSMDGKKLRKTLSEEARFKDFLENQVPRDQLARYSWGELVQALFEHYVEPRLIQPTFVIDHPKETTPLCKSHRHDERLIERFEPFVCGFEIGNAYSELNDPLLQRKLLEEQAELGRGGDEEAHQMDEDFCRAIEIGMPPTGGLGLGVDRLCMLLTGQTTIKDVLLFPLMKPKEE